MAADVMVSCVTKSWVAMCEVWIFLFSLEVNFNYFSYFSVKEYGKMQM